MKRAKPQWRDHFKPAVIEVRAPLPREAALLVSSELRLLRERLRDKKDSQPRARYVG
jgi:hypothetical protein